MTGNVVSTKMNHTVVVEVMRTFAHPLYRKTVRKSRRFAAHNTLDAVAVGDVVLIKETIPLSKTKHFVVLKKLS